MTYLSVVNPSYVRESTPGYSLHFSGERVYEVSLKTWVYSDWLRELPAVHRLVQALLQGQVLGLYHLLDFVIWPEGFFARISLRESPSLSECLDFLKEKSVPAGEGPAEYWDEELQWIKLVSPENLSESSRSFLERADQIRREAGHSFGFSPSLFFFYRDPSLTR